MALLKYNGEVFDVPAGGSVLETLLGNGQTIPNNCRAGTCQSCLMQVTKGKVPPEAQKGLKDSFKVKGFFLACCCKPEEDIDICLPDADQVRAAAVVSQITELSDDVTELKLTTEEPFEYYPGQFVTLWRNETLGRSYSLASLPQDNEELTFHIRLIPGGQFSGWVHNDLQVADSLYVQGPAGDCFYVAGNPEQNLLLIGTGTGLAPLYGIVRDALQQGHTGEIHLFHGALNPSGLYLQAQLTALAQQFSHFIYHPCVLKAEPGMAGNIMEGDISQLALDAVPKPAGWKTYLCGDQELVKKLRKQIFMAGCNMADIYADPFIYN